jgi:hypothetical protein
MPVGDFSNPLQVKRMSTTSAAPLEDPPSAAAAAAAAAAGVRAASGDGATSRAPGDGAAEAARQQGVAAAAAAMGAAPLMGSAHRDYENVTLMRMRQAAERARLIKEMEAKEKQSDQAVA